VIRRCPALLLAGVVASLSLAAWPPSVCADHMINYTLTNTSSNTINGVVLGVSPTNDIDESLPSPVTVLPGSTGFNPAGLNGATGDGTVPAGQPNAGAPLQVLVMNFFNGGFAPGGVLNFGLSVHDSVTTPPSLTLQLPASGLSIAEIPPVGSGTNSDPGTNNNNPPPNVPEPMSLAIWSVLTSLLLFRARAFRRAHTRLA